MKKTKELLNKLINFISENKHLVFAISVSVVSVIIILTCFNIFKSDSDTASDGEITFTREVTETYIDETTISSFIQTTEDETSQLSDLDYVNPDELNEETETTLEADNYPYLIKVNRLLNCVTVYVKDSNNDFTVPYISMACSTGKYINNTPLGTFRTSSKYPWRLMVDGTYSQYAYRIHGGILFHSVPCYTKSKDNMEVSQFNMLGSPASLGCIRLTVRDAKWIYDNCPYGTTVIIYDDATSPGPLGKPSVITIPETSPYAGWDPTDPDDNNPWNQMAPTINAGDVSISVGHSIDLMSGVTATDTCGNDITSSISLSGTYDVNTPGSYIITYSVIDLLGRSATKSIYVHVTVPETTTARPTETTTVRTPETTTQPEETTTVTPTTEETTDETTQRPSETTSAPTDETTSK